MKRNRCPFQSRRSKKMRCTHKFNSTTKEVLCIFKDELKCPYFREWLEMVTAENKLPYKGSKAVRKLLGGEDDRTLF